MWWEAVFNMPFGFCLAGNKQGASRRVWVVVKTKSQTQMYQGKGRMGGWGTDTQKPET